MAGRAPAQVRRRLPNREVEALDERGVQGLGILRRQQRGFQSIRRADLHAALDPDNTIVPPCLEHLTIDARRPKESGCQVNANLGSGLVCPNGHLPGVPNGYRLEVLTLGTSTGASIEVACCRQGLRDGLDLVSVLDQHLCDAVVAVPSRPILPQKSCYVVGNSHNHDQMLAVQRHREALVQVPRGIRFPTRWCRRPQLSHNSPVNSRVHPKYKTRYRIGNWPAYERALVQRGDLTLWLSPDAIAAWTPGLSGRPGGPRKFSDHAIETALTLRLVFNLPLRQTEGFLRSVLTLMATGLDAPDHTTLSRRGQPLDVALDRVPTHGPVDLVVDSTGLSVFSEGEWAAAKHGGRGKRGWKKLHLEVDRSGVIVAQALTEPTSDDATNGIRFVETVPGDVASVTADTAYDTVAFYAAASARDARVVVPPARTASLSRGGPRSSVRDRTIRRVQVLGRRRWKKAAGYHRQARAENAVFRYKSIIGPGLRARTEAGRQTEALLACNVLNRITELGRPASYRIGR